jgi:thiamine-monophosphate kinase
VAPLKARRAIGEFALIRTLHRRFAAGEPAIIRGIGDDAAVLAPRPGEWWHLTTDLLAEDVHFDLRTASFESVGYRAAVANLSDIAAMGAIPRYLLTSMAVPSRVTPSDIFRLYAGLMKACRPHGVKLIGGDTSASKTGLFLCIALIGTTARHRALFRWGAREGDFLYVTGTLGDSLAGLQLLTHSPRAAGSLSPSHRRFLVNRHLHPTARLAEGQWLNSERLATAAIDLSDGLSGDLRHICEESHVGAEVDLSKIPLSRACRAYGDAYRLDARQLALTGGEDYELLFTVAPENRTKVERQARAHGYRVTCIGIIRPRRSGIRTKSIAGHLEPLPPTSYEHFR